MNIRKAAFSGSWYPGDASACEYEIRSFLKEEDAAAEREGSFIGGIVPHAGWYFSGSIACRVIHRLSLSFQPDLVLIFGMHLHPGSTPCLMAEGAWETPFGPLPVAEELAGSLAKQFQFRLETPEQFTPDNTIELQLPFVKYFFKEARVLTIGTPPAGISLEIARQAVALAQKEGLSVRVIGSTDLTHYGVNYGFTPKGTGPDALEWATKENDRRFIDSLLAMTPPEVIKEGVEHQNACCAGAAASALEASLALGADRAELVSYSTSHDKHPGDSFVGYAGVLFS